MKRSFLRALVGTTAIVGAAMVALPHDADAALITQGGSTDIYISALSGGENVLVTGAIKFTTVSATKLVLDFNLENKSDAGARMVSFGWDFNPAGGATLTSASNTLSPGSWETTVIPDPGSPKDPGVNISDGFRIDICVWDGSGCTGGASGGLLSEGPNKTLTGALTINGSFSSPLYLENFLGKFQSLGINDQGSDVFTSTTPPPTDAPEPASLALLGVGLLGLGYATRRRRQAV